MRDNILALDTISAGYGDIPILHDISLGVERGGITALVGSNGAGKTTMMRAISGLLPVSGGRIAFDGADVGSLSPAARVELGISLVPEGRMIFPDFSVEENLTMGAYARRARADQAGTYKEVIELFPILRERRRQHAGTLSGGEQQMLALARSLMSRPELLLLDEPSLGLAPKVVAQLFETILAIRASGVTVFIVEQNIRRTLEIADYAYVLGVGRITGEGVGKALLSEATMQRAYLGM
jgi:branched-chain amino acid transport system ATP-binding protein